MKNGLYMLGGKPMFVDFGGPKRKISVGGKILTFEMHPYCGPSLLKKNGDLSLRQPMSFLNAVSLWAQQGQKIGKNGLCVWNKRKKLK